MSFPLRPAILTVAKSLALAALVLQLPAHAGPPTAQMSGFNTGIDQGGIKADYAYFYVNLLSTDGAGGNYNTWTDPNGHAGVRYISTGIVNYTQSWSCYEVYTQAVNFSNQGTDTRIYAQSDANGNFRSVSDDRSGTDYTSRFRAWIAPNTNYISLKVQGYSSGYNGIDFSLIIDRFPGISSESSCQISGVPFLRSNTSTYYPDFIGTN